MKFGFKYIAYAVYLPHSKMSLSLLSSRLQVLKIICFLMTLKEFLFWTSVFTNALTTDLSVCVALYWMILQTVSYTFVQALSRESRRTEKALLYDVSKCSKVRSLADTVMCSTSKFFKRKFKSSYWFLLGLKYKNAIADMAFTDSLSLLPCLFAATTDLFIITEAWSVLKM